MHDIDYGKSFLFFSTREHTPHTPRMRLDAACTLTGGPDGSPEFARTYFLTSPCIAESMYRDSDFIHDPAAEFIMIAKPSDQFVMLKRHASAALDIRSTHRFNEVMPTKDGKGARVIRLDVVLARLRNVQRIETYEQFHDAHMAGKCINGRTIFTDADGATRITMDYPASTTNVRHGEPHWQVDAGPVIIPADPRNSPSATPDSPEVARMQIGFMVFNRWDYAELVVREAMTLSPDQPALKTNHYHRRIKLACLHELYVGE